MSQQCSSKIIQWYRIKHKTTQMQMLWWDKQHIHGEVNGLKAKMHEDIAKKLYINYFYTILVADVCKTEDMIKEKC